MKCTKCGFEENMPAECFNEVVDIMIEDGDDDIPHIHCTRCDEPTFYPKDIDRFKKG